MTEHDDELTSRLTDYLQGYASYSRPATVERRQRRWPAAVAASLAAVIAAGAITGGYFALRPGPVAPGGAAEAVQLLFERNAYSEAGCARGEYATAMPSPKATPSTGVLTAEIGCNFATMPLTGGTLQSLAVANGPAAIDSLLDPGPLEGSQVLVVPTGSLVPPTGTGAAESSQTITGFYSLDLTGDIWSHLGLPASITDAPALASGGANGPDFTSAMFGVLSADQSEVAIPTDAGTPGLDVVDLASGSVRQLAPELPGGFAINAWLADGIHVSVACTDSTAADELCGYVINPVTGAVTRLPAEDGNIQIIASPDGTQELVVPISGMWTKVMAGPAGGPLETVYNAPSDQDVFPLDIGDDGSILTAVGSGSSWQEVILSGGATTTATPPKGGWAPAGMAPDPVVALPDGSFVAVVWTGPGPSVQELVRVMPDGSTSIIASVSENSAQLLGLAG
jgi:hypothetical protein